MSMLLNIVMELWETLLRPTFWGKSSNKLKNIRNKQEEKMVFHFTKSKQDLPCCKNNFIEHNPYIYKTTRFKKLCKCINRCINGNKQWKLHKNHIMDRFKNLKAIITRGYYNQDNNKRLLKLKNRRAITWLLFNFIWREVFLQELLMLFIIVM